MTAHLFIWGGPVSRYDLKARLPDDTDVLVISHGVDGRIDSDAFSLLAQSYLRDGHILPTLLAAYGRNMADYGDISLAGFSAFHGLANRLLLHDAEFITACVCLDACFSSFQKIEKAGYVPFGAMAARGERLFVMSGSLGGGQTFTTGSQCVMVNAQASLDMAGASPRDSMVLPEGVPAPVNYLQAESLVALDYQGLYTHGGHVHHLGEPLIEGYLVPWLETRRIVGMSEPAEEEETSEPSSHAGAWALLFLFGVGVSTAAVLKAQKQELSGNLVNNIFDKLSRMKCFRCLA